jgi:iron complex outermembrane receptor protein
MNSNPKLSYAIAAILSGTSVGISHAATATDASDSDSIQEITVTAQRRSQSIQDVPITIQAITGDQLKTLNVSTFDDLIRYTPNITFSGNGPGGGNIFMRGLSSGGSGNQSQSTTAPFPNVALYLDDQSMQFPARNNDIYMVDMERVEILEGPQGTLFGGGAQAGAIRYITNKPKLNVTEGNANASWGTTAGGDDNSSANATINLPLIADHLAVRATIFTDHRGGYIANVPGSISFPASPATPTSPGYPASPVATNGPLVGSNTNPVTYNGMRLSALYQINEDWNVLIQQNFQNMEADGYFASYPVAPDGTVLGPNQIVAFQPAYDKDRYESTAWTANGKIADFLNAVYTGSYMVRHIDAQADYSNYLTSVGGIKYSCTGAGATYFVTAKPTTCYPAVGNWNDSVENTHESHELRFSTPEQYRIRGLVGAFWETFEIRDQQNFNYLPPPQCNAANLATSLAGGPDCLSAVGPIPGTTASNPALRTGTSTAFGEDAQRGYTQTAFFASVDFDIIPKVLTVTGGIRHFHYDEFETGSEFYSESSSPLILNHPNGACVAAHACGFGIDLHKTESGDKVRGNITWHILPDVMAYYTYSQGFRPGGFNRTSSLGPTPSLTGEAPFTCQTFNAAGQCIKGLKASDQFNKPVGYSSDNLLNNEIGLKSEWFEHRLQANVSAYKMDWSGVQLPLFDPLHLGNTTFVINGPTYEVKGVELQLVGRPMEGLTVQGSSVWNSTNQTNAPCLTSNRATAGNPTPLGTCITQINSVPYTNPYGVLDTSPAFSPPLQFNLRARYDWAMGDYRPWVMAGANHIASQRNEPASFPDGASPLCTPVPTTTLCQYTMPGYTTYDASVGVAKDNWTATISGVNLTNVDASTFTSSGQFIKSEVPVRPRVLSLGFGYKF